MGCFVLCLSHSIMSIETWHVHRPLQSFQHHKSSILCSHQYREHGMYTNLYSRPTSQIIHPLSHSIETWHVHKPTDRPTSQIIHPLSHSIETWHVQNLYSRPTSQIIHPLSHSIETWHVHQPLQSSNITNHPSSVTQYRDMACTPTSTIVQHHKSSILCHTV